MWLILVLFIKIFFIMRAKRNKKIISQLVIGSLLLSPLFFTTVIACSNESTNDSATDDDNTGGATQPPQKPTINLNNSINRMPKTSTFHINSTKITKYDLERKIPSSTYQTEILKKWPTFKYPGWNFNYEASIDGKPNRYQEINNEKIDGMMEVWNERVEFNGEKVTYADPNFILNEIKNDSLKKHPAADLWFADAIDTKTNAVEKVFSISSAIKGRTPLGLYSAPGEVIEMKFDSKTLEKMKSQNIKDFKIVINDAFWNNFQPGNSGQISNRYPFVQTEFTINVDEVIKNDGVFKFGSPFGGTISILINTKLKPLNNSSIYPVYDQFNFKVSGALEMLSYNHLETTKADWDQQIKRVKEGKINAPAMSFNFPFGDINFSSTGKNQFNRIDVDDIQYPFEIMERWNDFLFVSEFFAGRDLRDSVSKILFQFNDDIQNSQQAFGGGDKVMAVLDWGRQAFLDGLVKDGMDTWTIRNQWGVFHEVNHNFQQNGVLFKNNDHPEANQVSLVALSLLADQGRFRNLYNADGNWSRDHTVWTRLENSWTTNQAMKVNNFQGNSKKSSVYELQTHLINTFGTFNFLDYTRDDLLNDLNNRPGWNGFEEIVRLSKWFKINLWPAMRQMGLWFNEVGDLAWPTDDKLLTPQQKLVVDELTKDFKAMDFMGNLFATGSYLWNEDKKNFFYTNDTQAPMDVPAGIPYVFDFEKGINSANPNLKWKTLKFNPTTALNGTLKADPNNSKILIYTPPKNSVGKTDEFDIAITDFTFDNNPPKNYIDQYAWKIKVRLVGNMPAITLYKDRFVPDEHNKAGLFKNDFDYLKDPNNIKAVLVSDPRYGVLAEPDEPNAYNSLVDKWTRAKISFDFIAPKTGNYKFEMKGLAWAFLVDRGLDPNSIIWENDNNNKPSESSWQPLIERDLQAGESLKLDLYISSRFKGNWKPNTQIDIRAFVNDNQNDSISIFDNSVVPWANQLIDDSKKLLAPEYQYQHRKLDMNQFQTKLHGLNQAPLTKFINKSEVDDEAQINYTFSLNNIYNDGVTDNKFDPKIDQLLTLNDNKFYEKWSQIDKPLNLAIDVDFTKPTNVGAIQFTNKHFNSNFNNARPTKIKVLDQDNKVLFEDLYGVEFNDRMANQTTVNIKATNVTKLTIILYNDIMFREPQAGKWQSGIVLDSIQFLENAILTTNRMIATNDPSIKYYGASWKNIPNDFDDNLSAVNNQALRTTKKDEYLEFNLWAEGFDVIGQKVPNGSKFALFINGQKIGEFDTNSDIRLDGQILASYQNSEPAKAMKIKIINLSDQKLTLDYFQTYGKKVLI